MRSVQLLLLCLLLACSTADAPTDGGPDAGTDASADTGDDARDSTQARDAGRDIGFDMGRPRWLDEPAVERIDMTPCEDWAAIDRRPRALPEDTTPRTLWYYFPPADPGYIEAESGRRSRLDWPTIAPDGSIWVTGPDFGQVSHLTREGTLIQTYRLSGNSYDNDEMGPIVAAPDGSVMVAQWGTDLDGEIHLGAVVHVDEEGVRGGISLDAGTRQPDVAIGPGGMVYISLAGEVLGTCRGERVMWRLTQELRQQTDFAKMRVLADGRLLVQYNSAQRFYYLTADGTVTAEVPIAGEDPYITQGFGGQTATARVIQLYDTESNSRVVEREGRRFTFSVSDRSPRLSPVDDLWLYHPQVPREPTRVYRLAPPSYDEALEISIEGAPREKAIWLQDGSHLGYHETDDDQLFLVRTSRDGERLWAIDFEAIDPRVRGWGLERSTWVVDDSGVLFMRANFSTPGLWALLAIQLDELPAPRTACVRHGPNLTDCNAQRDHWLRAE